MKFSYLIKLIVTDIILIILSILAGAFLYMTYSLCTILVAGQKFSAFNPELFLNGIFYLFPAALSVCPVFVSLYLIRHKEISGIFTAVYMVFHLCLWVFLLPVADRYLSPVIQENRPAEKAAVLSPGYFRETEDGKYVFYYSEVTPENTVSGICIDKTHPINSIFTFSNIESISEKTEFTDPLIKNTIKMPEILRHLLKYFKEFTDTAYSKCSEKNLEWIFFSSIIFAFMSVALIRRVSAWRLANVLFILMLYIFIFAVNYLIAHHPDFLSQKIPFRLEITGTMYSVIFNILIFVAAFILGLAAYIRRKKAAILVTDGDDD